MIPVILRTQRLVLDQPTAVDRHLVAEYCRDPLFEGFMTTPWPYELTHATAFVNDMVPMGWRTDTEYTWAIRVDGELGGMISFREELRMIGYWLGAPHRGHGYMTEAASAVVDWVFSIGRPTVLWECVAGNLASASVARKVGFRYTGTRPAAVIARDGSETLAWHGELGAGDDRSPRPGWPA